MLAHINIGTCIARVQVPAFHVHGNPVTEPRVAHHIAGQPAVGSEPCPQFDCHITPVGQRITPAHCTRQVHLYPVNLHALAYEGISRISDKVPLAQQRI